MTRFLEKKVIKIFNININPVIIGGLFSAMGSWNAETDKWLYVKGVFLIILFVWYTYTSYQYNKIEKGKEDEIKKLKEQLTDEKNKKEKEIDTYKKEQELLKQEIKNYDVGLRELTALFYDSADSINSISRQVLNGNRTLDIWNFKKVATGICNGIYRLLCEICAPYDDFTVNIMLTDVTAKGKKRNITMIAHKGKYEKYPGKFEEKLYFDKNNTFYAVKVCCSNNTDIRILTTKEEVNEKFVYVDEDHPEYSQYVGIPIVCTGNKILCLLQICSFKDNKIAETKAGIVDIISKYILPFTNYALLTYKVEKGLISGFSVIEKMEEGNISGKN